MKEGWTYKKLGEVCELIMGQSPESTSYNKEGDGLPFFQGCSDFGALNPNVTTYCSAPLKIAEPLDVLMSVRAPVGTLNIANVKCCIGRGLASFRQIEGLSVYKFLYYLLKSAQPIFQQNSTGATFKAIGKSFITNYKIEYPPFIVQKQIVSELDLLSDVIEKKKTQIEELNNLAQSTFYDMFGDPVTNEKGWEMQKVKAICTKITDGTHDTPQRLDNGIKFITGKHIRPFFIDYENSDYVTEDVHKEIYSRCNPEFGDVLYTNIGAGVGNAAVNIVNYEFSMKNVALLKFSDQKAKGVYIVHYLNEPRVKEKIIEDFSNGGAQIFLSLKSIGRITVPLPPLALQQEFAAKIEAIEQMKAKVRQSLKESEELFNSRMDYYFN